MQVAHQPVLIGLDQMIEQLRILPFQATRDCSVFTLDLLDSFGGEGNRSFTFFVLTLFRSKLVRRRFNSLKLS